jgi:hypothetical protein
MKTDEVAREAVNTVLAKLAAIGSSRQIAEFFEREGITGLVGYSISCPVANYVRREAGAMVIVGARFWSFPFVLGQNPIPDVVGDFVCHFDRGEWPQLARFGSDISE